MERVRLAVKTFYSGVEAGLFYQREILSLTDASDTGLPEHFQETGLSVEASICAYRTTAKAQLVIDRKSPLHKTWYLLAQDIFTRDVQPIPHCWPGYPPGTHLNEQEVAHVVCPDAPSRSISASSGQQEQDDLLNDGNEDDEYDEEISADLGDSGKSNGLARRMAMPDQLRPAAQSASPFPQLRRSTRHLGVVVDNIPALGEEQYQQPSNEDESMEDDYEY